MIETDRDGIEFCTRGRENDAEDGYKTRKMMKREVEIV